MSSMSLVSNQLTFLHFWLGAVLRRERQTATPTKKRRPSIQKGTFWQRSRKGALHPKSPKCLLYLDLLPSPPCHSREFDDHLIKGIASVSLISVAPASTFFRRGWIATLLSQKVPWILRAFIHTMGFVHEWFDWVNVPGEHNEQYLCQAEPEMDLTKAGRKESGVWNVSWPSKWIQIEECTCNIS